MLDVACATGYSTALLARLARIGGGAGGGRDAGAPRARESGGGRRRQCRGGERPACRTAGRPARPTTSSCVNGAAEVVPRAAAAPARGGRAAGRRRRPGAGQQGDALSRRPAGRRARCRSSMPRRRRCRASPSPRPSYSDTPDRAPSFPQRSVARKAQVRRVFHAFAPGRFPQGFRKALRSRLWLTQGRYGSARRGSGGARGRSRVVAWGR